MVRFRQVAFAVFSLLGAALSGNAQVVLDFPINFSAQQLSTTGIALVNTSPTASTAVFNLYGNDGLLVTQSTLSVPAGGQVAKLASEILPIAQAGGWIQIISSNSELQGFELIGDFAIVVDGAGPAAEGKQLAVVALSGDDIINVVNTVSQAATVQITLNDANGAALGTKSMSLAPFQPGFLKVSDIGGGSIGLVSISSNVTVSASLVTKLTNGQDVGVTNAAPVSTATSDLYFPFAPSGPQGASSWNSVLAVGNLGSASQTLTLTFMPDTGASISIQRNVAPGGTVGDSVSKLFSLPPAVFSAGWIHVTGSAPLTGVVAYQDASVGSLATVPSQSSGASRFFFGHIASLSPWYTGLALLNTTTTAANVTVAALDSGGKLIGTAASFTLPGGARKTALLSELVSQVLQRPSDGGFVFVSTTNSVPLLGFELFGNYGLPILANVQGFALPASSSFVSPGTPASVTIDKLTLTDGTTAQTSFAAGNTIVYDATITVPAGISGSAQLTLNVTDPQNHTLLSSSTPVPLTPGPIDVSFISYVPRNALNGQYTVSASLVNQGTTIGKTAVFSVTGGTLTPSVGQDPTLSMSLGNVTTLSFRPGDTVRFLIRTANFTGQSSSGVVNYQLTGPGYLAAGSGSLNMTVPVGISSQTVDMPIPTSAPIGLFAFTATLTAGGSTSTGNAAITVVPRSASEVMTVNNLFVADTNGVPQAGFAPGSGILLSMWRTSTFGVTTPATVRYTVTGPNSAAVYDQSFTLNLPNGPRLGFAPLTISSRAAAGTYTLQASITYLDNTNASQSSSLSTTFLVGQNTALTPAITVLPPVVMDMNSITRSSYSPSEPVLLLYSFVYSTFSAPVAGTLRYQVMQGSRLAADQTVDGPFAGGITEGYGAIGSVPSNFYTFTVTATAQSLSSTATTTFLVTGANSPGINFSLSHNNGNSHLSEGGPLSELFQSRTRSVLTNDRDEANGISGSGLSPSARPQLLLIGADWGG